MIVNVRGILSAVYGVRLSSLISGENTDYRRPRLKTKTLYLFWREIKLLLGLILYSPILNVHPSDLEMDLPKRYRAGHMVSTLIFPRY